MSLPKPRRSVLLARLMAILFAVAAGLAGGGCAGYKLGPTSGSPAGSSSVEFVPFSNQTLEPHLADELNLQLRKQMQRDGTYRLATREDGDIVVRGVITKYERQEVSFVPSDVLTVRDYRLVLTAQVSALKRSTGTTVFNQKFSGSTLIRVGTDLTSTERQAFPLLAEDLARRVTDRLVDGSW